MRIRKDKTSWRSSGIIKRDSKHGGDGYWSPEHPTHHASKRNTRKWCKGVVGQKHDYKKYSKPFVGDLKIEIAKCTKCKKEKWGGFIRSDTE